jgi:phospholipid/cholesterol/gamma-HCH transport system ATP-binding protein
MQTPGTDRRLLFMATILSTSLVELRNLTFGYGERVVLDNISLTLPRGRVTALMGVSGGGKTTVLRLIGGQNRAQKGELRLYGPSTRLICIQLDGAWACCFSSARCLPI